MMTQIGIHNDNEVPFGMFDSMNVSRTQSQFSLSRTKYDFLFTENLLQFFGHF